MPRSFEPDSSSDQSDDESQDEFDVDCIVDAKMVKGKKMYLVKWVGYSDSENTWEPLKNLNHCWDKIQHFQENRKKSPKKRSRTEDVIPKASPSRRKKLEPEEIMDSSDEETDLRKSIQTSMEDSEQMETPASSPIKPRESPQPSSKALEQIDVNMPQLSSTSPIQDLSDWTAGDVPSVRFQKEILNINDKKTLNTLHLRSDGTVIAIRDQIIQAFFRQPCLMEIRDSTFLQRFPMAKQEILKNPFWADAHQKTIHVDDLDVTFILSKSGARSPLQKLVNDMWLGILSGEKFVILVHPTDGKKLGVFQKRRLSQCTRMEDAKFLPFSSEMKLQFFNLKKGERLFVPKDWHFYSFTIRESMNLVASKNEISEKCEDGSENSENSENSQDSQETTQDENLASVNILKFLEKKDLLNARLISKRTKFVFSRNEFWKPKFLGDFAFDPAVKSKEISETFQDKKFQQRTLWFELHRFVEGSLRCRNLDEISQKFQFMIQHRLLSSTDLSQHAKFLFKLKVEGLMPEMLGEYLTKEPKLELVNSFMAQFDFREMNILDAFR
eukprot:TRINITY_DN1899_c1_g1_i3.p1 TRINITY_DN1899_c1_g1~~TRINITY_DN1899_c1_g1_i3.p1  ORF type:complete len:555 (+),score=187.82 TRINITY_DN1899_c1_g1_i3:70-1734(+)